MNKPLSDIRMIDKQDIFERPQDNLVEEVK